MSRNIRSEPHWRPPPMRGDQIRRTTKGSILGSLVVLLPTLPLTCVTLTSADEVLYRYEADVMPYDESAGWIIFEACEDACSETIEDGHYKTVNVFGSNGDYNHTYIIDNDFPPPLPSLWAEWRHRSNHAKPPNFLFCNAVFVIRYERIIEAVYLFGDAMITASGNMGILGLDIDEFHTFRFESTNGESYLFSVDGAVLVDTFDNHNFGGTFLQFGGLGGCTAQDLPAINEWDHVRFGTIARGEQILAVDPPAGFVDACASATLDHFAITFDSANFVHVHEITVSTSAGSIPIVLQTRRRADDEPDTLEVVLDRPIPYGATTTFTIDDGVSVNVIEYTYAPADTNGDGRADLADVAVFMACFGQSPLSGPCLVLDNNEDGQIDLADHSWFVNIFVQQ